MCCCLFTANNSQSVTKAAISSLQHTVHTVFKSWTRSGICCNDGSSGLNSFWLLFQQSCPIRALPGSARSSELQQSNLSCCFSLMSDVWLGYFLRSHDKAWTHQHIIFNLGFSHVLHLDNMAAATASTLLFSHYEFFPCSELLSPECVGFLRGIEGEPQSGEAEKPSLQTDERGEVYKSTGPLEHCLRRYHELITLTWDVKFLLPHK